MAGNYVRVRCGDCENEQVVFTKAATAVSCAVCGTTLAVPSGGIASIEHELVETVEQRSPESRLPSGETAEAQ